MKKQCPNCGVGLHIQEFPLGASIGNKCKEEATCCKCGEVVYERMISGVFEVKVADNNDL